MNEICWYSYFYGRKSKNFFFLQKNGGFTRKKERKNSKVSQGCYGSRIHQPLIFRWETDCYSYKKLSDKNSGFEVRESSNPGENLRQFRDMFSLLSDVFLILVLIVSA